MWNAKLHVHCCQNICIYSASQYFLTFAFTNFSLQSLLTVI